MFSRTLLLSTVLASCLARTVAAEPITITGGGLTYPAPLAISITLQGTGFTFTGSASPGIGIFFPTDACFASCTPGGTVNLKTVFTSGDLPGSATLNGRTFAHVGSLSADSSAGIDFEGTLLIPANYVTGTSVSAPFQFTGSFAYEIDPRLSWAFLDLVGSGTATIIFRSAGDTQNPGRLRPQSVVYAFETAAQPTPEPASMILVASGIAAVAAASRRRKAP